MKRGGATAAYPRWVLLAVLSAMTPIAHPPTATASLGGAGIGGQSIMRFRRFAESFGGQPPSWWDWQETSARGWRGLGAPVVGPVFGPVDGAIGTSTWSALLDFAPVRPGWAGRRARRGDGAAASGALPPRRPLSASLPVKAYEIDPGPAP